MKFVLALSLVLQPYISVASNTSNLKYSISIGSRTLSDVIKSQTYAPGGEREGQFFEDLAQSVPALKQKEVDDFYSDKFAYEINDYYMQVALDNAKAEGNPEIVNDLKLLRDDYRKPTVGGGWAVLPKVYKQKFLEILHKQFDQRVAAMVVDFNSRLQKHGGDYTTMLTEYQNDLSHLENQRIGNGIKKFVFFVSLGAAGFATVFLGIPLIIPLLIPSRN